MMLAKILATFVLLAMSTGIGALAYAVWLNLDLSPAKRVGLECLCGLCVAYLACTDLVIWSVK